jgi:hypothetical protein
MECISATGRRLTPLIIFKGLSIQQQWFPVALKDHNGWQFTATKKGWIEEKIAIEWVRKVFLPLGCALWYCMYTCQLTYTYYFQDSAKSFS